MALSSAGDVASGGELPPLAIEPTGNALLAAPDGFVDAPDGMLD